MGRIPEIKVKFAGGKLRALREARSQKKQAVASGLGITAQSYGQMEKGSINPSAENVAKLCFWFNCEIADLFDVTQSDPNK